LAFFSSWLLQQDGQAAAFQAGLLILLIFVAGLKVLFSKVDAERPFKHHFLRVGPMLEHFGRPGFRGRGLPF